MLPHSLTKQEKGQCKVILALLIVSLIMEKINLKLGKDKAEVLPAVAECTKWIDKVLADKDAIRRTKMLARIDTIRIRLTKKLKDVDMEIGLLGGLRFLTGGTFKTAQGTQLSFIIETFAKNLKAMETRVPDADPQITAVEKTMREIIQSL